MKKGKAIGRFTLHPWHWLLPAFIVFWVPFTIMVIASGFPFLLFSGAMLSLVVIVLAWACHNNL